MPMEPELVLSDPPAVVTGRVLAADTFRVPATDTNFQVQPFSSGGAIPADLGPTTGKLLVLSLRDASRPDIACTGGIGGSNCAIIVALPSREEGFVSVATTTGRRRLYIQSTFQLDVDPEPS